MKKRPMINIGSGFQMHESFEMKGLEMAKTLDTELKNPNAKFLMAVGYSSLVVRLIAVNPASIQIIDKRKHINTPMVNCLGIKPNITKHEPARK